MIETFFSKKEISLVYWKVQLVVTQLVLFSHWLGISLVINKNYFVLLRTCDLPSILFFVTLQDVG